MDKHRRPQDFFQGRANELKLEGLRRGGGSWGGAVSPLGSANRFLCNFWPLATTFTPALLCSVHMVKSGNNYHWLPNPKSGDAFGVPSFSFRIPVGTPIRNSFIVYRNEIVAVEQSLTVLPHGKASVEAIQTADFDDKVFDAITFFQLFQERANASPLPMPVGAHVNKFQCCFA